MRLRRKIGITNRGLASDLNLDLPAASEAPSEMGNGQVCQQRGHSLSNKNTNTRLFAIWGNPLREPASPMARLQLPRI